MRGKVWKDVSLKMFFGLAVLFCIVNAWKMTASATQVTAGVYRQLSSAELDEESLYMDYIYPCEAQGGFYYVKKASDGDSYFQDLDIMFCDVNTGNTKKVLSIERRTMETDSENYYELVYGTYYYSDGKFYYDSYRTEVGTREDGVPYVKYYNKIRGIDLSTGETCVEIDLPPMDNILRTIGVDALGRIYVGSISSPVYLYSSSGELLSITEESYTVLKFLGFDSVNGNFYFRGCYNWRYWGYDHSMASLQAGNVTDNVIKVKGENITIQYQLLWGEHVGCAEMISDRYLADLSAFSNDSLAIIDSNAYDYTDVAETGTSISLMGGGVSVTFVAVKDASVVKMKAQTFDSEYENNRDTTSVGARCAYNADNGNVMVATGRQELTEFNISNGEKIATMNTKQPIFKVMRLGNVLVLLERTESGEFYIETCQWVYPTQVTISGPSSVVVGDSGTFTQKDNGTIALGYTFSSSDSNILSIDENGKAAAWKAGTVTVTVTSKDGRITSSMKVTVTNRNINKTRANAVTLPGIASDNKHDGLNNSTYGEVVQSYLVDTGAGSIMRVEYVDGKIIVENYSAQNKFISSKTIDKELPLFGGFFSGNENYYLVFGAENETESDTKEVLRVVKYSKSWQRISDCKISAINTYIPFEAGSLRMTETDSTLYIHTCHEMYESDDGYNHQANMTFAINKDEMKVTDSYTDVMNVSYGYVSHSFNQFIQTDGTYVYRVDHGDAYPRGVAITKYHVDDKMSDVSYCVPLKFAGGIGDNDTGATLGGMEISDTDILVAGNYTNTNEDMKNPRNVFVVVMDREFKKDATVKYITNYKAGSKYTVGEPKLVKIDSSHFLLMWREKNTKKSTYTTKLVQLDSKGNKVGSVITTNIDLSDCQPIVLADGTVSWYVTGDGAPILYNVDPFNLSEIEGKVEVQAGTTLRTASGLTYQLNKNKTATLVSADKKIKKCTIPSKVYSNGKAYKVTKIKKKAFEKCTSLKEVTIGTNVKTIESKAFNGCNKLTKITLGESVTTIGSYAFSGCKKIKNITLGDKVKKIGSYAFKGCTQLRKITIKSKKLTNKNVSQNAFKGISKKAKVLVPESKFYGYKKLLKKKGLSKKIKLQKL